MSTVFAQPPEDGYWVVYGVRGAPPTSGGLGSTVITGAPVANSGGTGTVAPTKPGATVAPTKPGATVAPTKPGTATTAMRNLPHSGTIDFVSGKGYKLELSTDGALLIKGPNNFPTWVGVLGGKGTAPYKLDLRPDGNLIVVDSKGVTTWQSGSGKKGTAPYRARVQDSGHLFIYDSKNALIWQSNAPTATTAPKTMQQLIDEMAKSEQGKALLKSMQTPTPSSTTSRSVSSAPIR